MSADFYTVGDLLTAIDDTTGHNAAIGGALNGVRALTDAVHLTDSDTPLPRHFTGPTNGGGGTPANGAAAPAPVLAPINPVDALRQLAEAISEAERTLNKENLVVATGDLDIELNVDVGGIAGAHAKFTLHVAPKSFG